MAEATRNDYINAFESTNRYRSWLFVTVNDHSDPYIAAKQIFEDLGNPYKVKKEFGLENDGDIVVVRVDVINPDIEIKPGGFHLIIPVDTKDSTEMDRVKQYIEGLKNGEESVVASPITEANVQYHFPQGPYFSNGFISDIERTTGKIHHGVGPEQKDEGLTRRSPGDNPWG